MGMNLKKGTRRPDGNLEHPLKSFLKHLLAPDAKEPKYIFEKKGFQFP
jgi:hypothetical protein